MFGTTKTDGEGREKKEILQKKKWTRPKGRAHSL